MSLEDVVPNGHAEQITVPVSPRVAAGLDQPTVGDLEDFFENGTIGLHIVGGDGTILRANKAELAMLGYDASEYVGHNIKEFHADEEAIDDILTRLKRGEKLDKHPARLRTKDGQIRDVLVSSSVQFCNGNFLNTRCFTIDITERKIASDILFEQTQRFSATYEHADIGITEVDADGRRLRVNKTACEILGLSREKLVGSSPYDIMTSSDGEHDRDQHQRLVAGKIDRYTAQSRYTRPDGNVIWIDLMGSAVRDAAGRFLYSVRVFRDITAAKHAAEALAESRQRLAVTYEHAGVGISEVDENGKLLHVNETACKITGYSREELLKLSVFEVTHPDDRQPDEEKFLSQIRDGEEPITVEKRLIRKGGEVIWVSITSSVIRDSSGKFLYGIRVMQDVTERKQSEQRLRDSEHQFRQLIEALPAAVYTTDAQGRITFFNQAAVDLAGRTPKIGEDKWCVTWKLHRTDGTLLPHDECPMAVALKEGRPVRGLEAVAERPDGSRVPFIPYPTPMRDAFGTVIGAVNMLADISERKQSEANQKMLLDELNHRVKNNMQMLTSLVRTAQREAENPKAREVLGDAADRISAMAAAQQVLYDSGATLAYSAKPFLGAVCASASNALSRNIGIDIIDCTEDRLSNDTAMPLALVAHELIINAAKHGSAGRKKSMIRVSLVRQGENYVLTVADDGPGFTLDQVRKRASGLGLVVGLSRQLGGTFSVEKDGGARCVVKFSRGGHQARS